MATPPRSIPLPQQQMGEMLMRQQPQPRPSKFAGMPSPSPAEPPEQVPYNEMAAFQGFPGPMPGQAGGQPMPTGDEATKVARLRALERLQTLNLPPEVLARVAISLSGQPEQEDPQPVQPGGGTINKGGAQQPPQPQRRRRTSTGYNDPDRR